MTTEFLLIFFRVAGLVFTAPVLGSKAIGIRYRIALCVVLSIASFSLLTPDWSPQNLNLDIGDPGQLLSQSLAELCIGVSMGLGTMIIFSSAQMAGTVLGQMSGLSFFGSLDPASGENGSTTGTLFGLTSTAVFILMQGPELVVSSVLQSFGALPPGSAIDPVALIGLLPELLQQSFVLTLGGIGPGVAAILATSLAFGFVCRIFPNMNLTSLAIASNTSMMFLSIFLTLGGCVWLFMDDIGPTLESISSVLSENVEARP